MTARRPAFVLFLLASLAACPGSRSAGDVPQARGSASTATSIAAPLLQPDAGADGDVPKMLTRDEICARAVTVHAASLPSKKPFTQAAAHCTGGDAFCDTIDKAPDPKDTCFVANDNISRAERESRGGHGATAPAIAAWDGEKAPKYLDRIDAHFHLTSEERAKLKQNRFVVLDRLAYKNYAAAFHDVFQEELPLFVGIDPVLHAVFRGTELALERVERARLIPSLMSMLKKLRGALATSTMDAETKDDLDIYLGVAAALGPVQPPPPPRPGSSDYAMPERAVDKAPAKLSALRGAAAEKNGSAIKDLVQSSTSERELKNVTLFGRERMIDFSQMDPRGHYVENGYSGSSFNAPRIDDYFRAMMWLSRLEMNLVSRSSRSSDPGPALDPRETPREMKDALALAELIERSGASIELAQFEAIYTSFAGKREDVSPAKLLAISKANNIHASDADVATKLKTAIGSTFKRTARTHFTVEGVTELPTILTMFGPRIVPDVAPLTRVVHDQINERKWLGAADAGYILGHDRAKTFIKDWAEYPPLPEAMKKARAELETNAAASHDIYGSWLRSVLEIPRTPTGVVPSFVKTDAYADRRLESALVGFGQIRHAFVLLAAQGYDAYGCEIPDAFVEPLPAVYDALLAHVRNMRSANIGKGWGGLERTIATLASIAHNETSGRVLTEPERRWLGMVSEHIPMGGYVSTGEPPKWTGWYFDMFEDREHGATGATSFIADYFTLTNANEVAYLGAEGPRLAVFIVDTNGAEPRAMVGPVAKGFEAHAPIAGRLSDEKVFDAGTKRESAWRASFAVPEMPEPLVGLQGEIVRCGDIVDNNPHMDPSTGQWVPAPATPKPQPKFEWRVAIRSKRAVGKTSVTLLDHHSDALTQKLVFDIDDNALKTNEGWLVGAFDLPNELAVSHFGVEALHVRIDDLARSRTGTGPYDYASSPSVFAGKDYPSENQPSMPERRKGPGYFTIGIPAKPVETPPKPPMPH